MFHGVTQAQHDYLQGNYPVVREDASQMCALQMQAEAGPTLLDQPDGLEPYLEKFIVKQVGCHTPQWLMTAGSRIIYISMSSKSGHLCLSMISTAHRTRLCNIAKLLVGGGCTLQYMLHACRSMFPCQASVSSQPEATISHHRYDSFWLVTSLKSVTGKACSTILVMP